MCETSDAIHRMIAEGKTNTEIGKVIGVTPEKVRTILTALEIDRTVNSRPVYTVRGITGSIDYLIKHFGVDTSRGRVHDRVRRGKSLEEALLDPKFGHKCEWGGKVQNISEILSDLGLHHRIALVRKCIQRGFTPVEAINRTLKKSRTVSHV